MGRRFTRPTRRCRRWRNGRRASRMKSGSSPGRRPLRSDHLDQQGVLKRTHGAAIYKADTALPALEERSSSQPDEKRLIARAAAAPIGPLGPAGRIETDPWGGDLQGRHGVAGAGGTVVEPAG